MVLELIRHARGFSYDVLLYNGVSVAGSAEQVRQLADGRCDGAITVLSRQGGRLEKLAGHRLPVIQIGSPDVPEGVGAVSFADRQTAFNATHRLIDLGHRRIAHCAGPVDLWDYARERLAGYRQALEAARIPWDPSIVCALPDWSGKGVSDLCGRCFQGPAPPTAAVTCNKATALQVQWHLTALGIRIPDQLSLMALDDFGGSDFISAVEFPVAELASVAVQDLLRVIEGELDASEIRRLIPGRLALRGSCRALGAVVGA